MENLELWNQRYLKEEEELEPGENVGKDWKKRNEFIRNRNGDDERPIQYKTFGGCMYVSCTLLKDVYKRQAYDIIL